MRRCSVSCARAPLPHDGAAPAGDARLSPSRAPLPPAELQERVGRARSMVAKLTELTTRMLDLTSLQEGRTPFRPVAFDLAPLIADVVHQQRLVTPQAAIDVSGDAAPLTITADPDLVARILRNLVENAVKYSPPGAPVAIAARREAEALRLDVSDRGIGIPADEQSRVFECFYRASSAGPTRGTGLGLFITRQLVELHGGSIELHSEPGVGSRFTVRLPQ